MRQFFLIPLLCVAHLGLADNPPPTLEQKLLNSIATSQIREHDDARNVGLWWNTIQAQEDERSFAETDIFTGLHTMLILHEVNAIRPLPGYDEIRQRFQQQYELYRKDSTKKDALNFWPLRANGTHNFTTDPKILAVTGIPDLFNDFDDSALGFLWQMTEGQVDSKLPKILMDNIDSKSGAFYTWDSPLLRNTDCVVNLNILHALAVYQKQGGELPTQLLAAQISARLYVKTIIEDHKTDRCASFYSRSSQFFIALAKVAAVNEDFVQALLAVSKQELKHLAKDALKSTNGTEIAEYIIALKLFSKSERDEETASLIADLTENLKKRIHQTPYLAFLSGDSVFMGVSHKGEWAYKEQHWYSPAQSTATALLALTLL